MKVLMVCLGNICRSPLAEGLMARKIKAYGLDWEVESAGTGGWHVGEQPDPRSIEVAEKHDLDITYQRGRQFSEYDFERFDLIYAMDTSNYRDVTKLANTEEERSKVKLILNELIADSNESVPDPYWDDDGFEQVYQMLDDACEAIINKYK
ncbi:MAG: low molecular weight protein-tyrosine-phosphatase [Chitinophagales bacterium]